MPPTILMLNVVVLVGRGLINGRASWRSGTTTALSPDRCAAPNERRVRR